MANKDVIERETSVHPVILNLIIAFERTKIKWHGSFEELKLFVETHLNLKGKWNPLADQRSSLIAIKL